MLECLQIRRDTGSRLDRHPVDELIGDVACRCSRRSPPWARGLLVDATVEISVERRRLAGMAHDAGEHPPLPAPQRLRAQPGGAGQLAPSHPQCPTEVQEPPCALSRMHRRGGAGGPGAQQLVPCRADPDHGPRARRPAQRAALSLPWAPVRATARRPARRPGAVQPGAGEDNEEAPDSLPWPGPGAERDGAHSSGRPLNRRRRIGPHVALILSSALDDVANRMTTTQVVLPSCCRAPGVLDGGGMRLADLVSGLREAARVSRRTAAGRNRHPVCYPTNGAVGRPTTDFSGNSPDVDAAPAVRGVRRPR